MKSEAANDLLAEQNASN